MQRGRCIAPKETQPQKMYTPILHNSMLAKIIGNYKAAVTREYRQKIVDINKESQKRIWQRLYHENIIRTQKSYDNIMNYIDNNIENSGTKIVSTIRPAYSNVYLFL